LLDRYGYRDPDGDGWRERPDGSPFVLTLSSAVTASRDADELWQRSLKAVGLRLAFNKQRGSDLLKASALGKLQMYATGMGPNPPEGLFYLDLLYGPFAGNINHSRFALAEFDRLYERIREMPHGPARDRELRRASELVAVHAPFVLHAWRMRTTLVRPWVTGYGGHPFHADPWPLLDVDTAARPTPRR
jgi:ABC-type transport system substrate-binding protein